MKVHRTPCYFILAIVVMSCSVTWISGYDAVIDNTTTKLKSDFNLHFIKLSRTLQDNDPSNQKFELFQDYYDHMNVDLINLSGRAQILAGKSGIIKKQIHNLDSTMHAFEDLHKKGLPDRPGDDRRDIRNGINSSIDAVIRLQEELRTTGKLKSTN